MTPELERLPASQAELRALQRERKRVAVQRARQAPFFRERLRHVDPDKLDDPEEWARIPILDKETLRRIPEREFLAELCIAPRTAICEYWRSGGSTGRPLFYPRTHEDIRLALIAFARSYQLAGLRAGQQVHDAFPLGVHPAGQMWARAAGALGIGITWAGAGSSTPSELQLELLDLLAPDAWMGMASYGLHLLNLAEAEGRDLTQGSVRIIMTSAEPLSEAKRRRLEAGWGAKVFDCYGMTEVSLLGAEDGRGQGFHFWSDFAYPEVLDPGTLEPVPDGQPGLLVVTPLFTNNATPFLRWSSGDLVIREAARPEDAPFDVFPIIRHARRTEGFFKVRGINVNHADFEELMQGHEPVRDFRLDVCNEGGLDTLVLSIELAPDGDAARVSGALKEQVRARFELRCEVEVLPPGALAAEHERSIKPVRFRDLRDPA